MRRTSVGTDLAASRRGTSEISYGSWAPLATSMTFLEWAQPWSPGFELEDLATRMTADGRALDLFCREAGARTPKELFWVGDGIQVWWQLLMHLYRARGADVVVLDEPDLYLHADLQRQLVRVLESLDCQTIAASHSAELLVEASPRSVGWVDKTRQAGVRAPDESVLTRLSEALGSAFNLRLARALRARAVLFVEGQDMRVLRNFARTLGATELVRESGLVTIPLQGFTNWTHVEPFAWLVRDLLERSVQVMVVLDRDYRSHGQVADVSERLGDLGVSCHVWRRKELESYVLEAGAMARVSGAAPDEVRARLVELAEERRTAIVAGQLAERQKVEVDRDRHAVDVTERHAVDFERVRGHEESRPHLAAAKEILARLNRWLQSAGYSAVSARGLSARMRRDEIAQEMADVVERAEGMME